MPSLTILVKRQNHRVHLCNPERKDELLDLLLERNAELSILVVSSNAAETIKNRVGSERVTVVNDEELGASERICDLLISYDLPEKAELYAERLSHVKTHALVLLDPNEQKLLYPIETLLGRTLMKDPISGFEPTSSVKIQTRSKLFNANAPKRDYASEEKNDKKKQKENNPFGKKTFGGKPGAKPQAAESKPRPAQVFTKESVLKGVTRKINIKSAKASKESK
jgi:hypothetical protein